MTMPLGESFRTFGFAVLRQFFDPGPLSMEVDMVLSEGLTGDGCTLETFRELRWAE
jgi:hypothetical protein